MTRPLSLLAVFGITAAFANCGDAPTDIDEKEPAVATTITLSEAELTLDPGATDTIDASVVDQYGEALPGATLEWTSSNEEVATVTGGVITAEHTGTSIITATSGDAFQNATIHVSPDPVEPIIIEAGDTIQGSISTNGDVDLFTFTATQYQLFNVYFQDMEEDDSFADLRVYYGSGEDGVAMGGIGQEPSDSLRDVATGRFRAAWPGEYTIVVSSSKAETHSGVYRFELLEIDPAPENVDGEISMGEIIEGESVDFSGDLDAFTYHASEGDAVRFNLQPISGAGTLELWAYYEYGTDDELGPWTLVKTGPTDGLGEAWGGLYHPWPGGYTMTVTVIGNYEAVGGYRLQMAER